MIELVLDLLVGLLHLRILGVERVILGLRGVVAGDLLGAQLRGLGIDTPHAGGVAIGKADRRLDPLPTVGANGLGIDLQLFEDQLRVKSGILEPAATILLEQVAQDDAAGSLISSGADIDCAAIVGTHRGLRQQAPDVIGLLHIRVAGDAIPVLLLADMVVENAMICSSRISSFS